jgi:hypothetical protein
MSGSGAEKRNNVLAIRAAKLASQGWTHRNIAEAIGKRPEQIKALILKGERLAQVKP